MSPALEHLPVWAIVSPYPGLLGAAHAPPIAALT